MKYRFLTEHGRLALLGAALLVMLPTPNVAQDAAAPIKVGVVNLDEIARLSPAGEALRSQVEAFQAEVATEVATRQAAQRALEEQMAAAPDDMAPAERVSLERQYQDLLRDFQRFQEDRQAEVDALQFDGLARIQEEIGPAIQAVQVELGYDLVLNSADNVVVLFSDRVDITDVVVERLQAGTPSGS